MADKFHGLKFNQLKETSIVAFISEKKICKKIKNFKILFQFST